MKSEDKFAEDFCNYIQFKGERGNETSIQNIGWQLEQAGWIADIMLGLLWVLIKKNILTKKDMKEIMWRKVDK